MKVILLEELKGCDSLSDEASSMDVLPVPEAVGDGSRPGGDGPSNPVADALRAEPLGMEQLCAIATASCGAADARSWLMERLVEAELAGAIARHPDGRWGPAAR